jgi:DnaJ domain
MTVKAWYWHFLGLEPWASEGEIRSAYRRLAKLLHGDHGGTDADMQRLNEAYRLALAEPQHEPPARSGPPSPPPSGLPLKVRASIFAK